MSPESTPVFSDPNKPGVKSSEFNITVVVGIIGAVVAGLSLTISQLQDVLPTAGWVTVAAGIVAGLGTVVGIAMKYVGSRGNVKVGQLQLQAAEMLRDAEVARATLATPKTLAEGTTFVPPGNP